VSGLCNRPPTTDIRPRLLRSRAISRDPASPRGDGIRNHDRIERRVRGLVDTGLLETDDPAAQ